MSHGRQLFSYARKDVTQKMAAEPLSSMTASRPEIPAAEPEPSLTQLAEKRIGGDNIFGRLHSHAGNFSPAAHDGCDGSRKTRVARNGR